MKNHFIVKDDVTEIHIDSIKHGKFIVLIDTEDLARVSEKFRTISIDAQIRPTLTSYYARGSNRGKQEMIHRYLMDCPNDKVVDHIDGNPLNNRKSNLRICTQGENTLNSQNRGKYPKGVSFNKGNGKFVVRITVKKGVQKHIGYYETLEEAVAVAQKEFKDRGITYR